MANRSDERTQFLADVIHAAIEGGTNHWARVYRYKWEGLPPAEVHAVIGEEGDDFASELADALRALRDELGHKPTVSEALAHGVLKEVTVDTIARGLGLLVRGEVSIASDLRATLLEADRENDATDIDACLASCIVETAVLGEVRYT